MHSILTALPEFKETRWLGLDWSYISIIGGIGSLMFAARFGIQWIESERRGESVVPMAFWYFSILGTIFQATYFILKRDPIGIISFAPNAFIYMRNIQLVKRKRARDQSAAAALKDGPPAPPELNRTK